MFRSISKDDVTGRNFFFFLFSVVSCSVLWSVYIDKHLSADGVNYFCHILDDRNFTFIDWSRQHANFLIEWLIVFAVKAGVKDIRLLSLLLGAGIYLVFLLSFLLSNAALRKEDKALLIFPVASMTAINLTTDYILIGEHQALVLLSWPILFLVMRNDLKLVQYFLLWGLLVVYSCLYQSAFFTGLIFLGIITLRMFRERSNKLRKEDIISAILCLAVITIALQSAINPRSETNRDSFVNAVPVALLSREMIINLSFLALFAISFFIKNKNFVLLTLIPVVVYISYLFLRPEGITASQSFAARSLSVTVLPFMLLFAFIFSTCKFKLTKKSAIIFTFYVIAIVSGNIYHSKGWINFHRNFVNITENNTGFVPIEETGLNKNPCGWVWNNSQLGIVWSSSCVKSIILNKPNLKFEPFDPHADLILKDYVKYDPYFLSINKNITVCNSDHD